MRDLGVMAYVEVRLTQCSAAQRETPFRNMRFQYVRMRYKRKGSRYRCPEQARNPDRPRYVRSSKGAAFVVKKLRAGRQPRQREPGGIVDLEAC
jgi:hypothetical protein